MEVGSVESETIAEIERLELAARQLRPRLESTRRAEDRAVLERQMVDLRGQINRLRERLNPRPPRLVPFKD
jgi:hypothetical protein